jgi:DNA replication protein DnaC
LCRQLKLSTIAGALTHLAQRANANHSSFTDFLEAVLKAEQAARLAKQRTTLSRLASLPAIKILEGFDFEANTGVPKAQVKKLANLAFIERHENVVPPQRPPVRQVGGLVKALRQCVPPADY